MQVSDIAREMSAFARMGGVADIHDIDAICRSIELMQETEAITATDVLALLVTARAMLNGNTSPAHTVENHAQTSALLLIRNAIQAMEKLSGEASRNFSTQEWH